MSTTLTLQDRFALLAALPAPRLCQMLCILSQEEQVDRIWALLVWIEAERRARGAKLPKRTATRLRKVLFPGASLERLFDPQAWFDPTIFELVTESVIAPLLGARGQVPETEHLLEIVADWSAGDNHPFFAIRSFVKALPAASASALLPKVRGKQVVAARSAQPQKQVAQLFHVLLYLFHRDFLTHTEMVNLFGQHLVAQSGLCKRLAKGLKAYYAEIKKLSLSQS